jgi:squalene-associated FAD-dependent desaturase
MNSAGDRPSVVVVGGGLAGLAAAVALGGAGCRVELFEARRSLGGRATSFRDPATEEWVDHCQHVSMGCCTNLADFCRRTGISEFFRRDRVVNFIGPDCRLYRLRASRLLPAPFHLAPSFWRLRFLSLRDRLAVARALWKLMRTRLLDGDEQPTVGEWLRRQGQSAAAIERFWGVILTSALGEELDRASLSAARKVLVDGFLAARDAYIVEIPEAPLGTLYGDRLAHWLFQRGVTLHLNAPIRQVAVEQSLVVTGSDGAQIRPDYVVIAVPWSKIADLVSREIAASWPWLSGVGRIEAAPITGVHLWFDRPIMSLPHAVLVDRLSQWVFSRGQREAADRGLGHYYQVVISASRGLAGRDRREVVAQVCAELAAIWPAAAAAELVHWRVVTDPAAVFSARPGLDRLRPPQQTSTPGVLVAGDWTATFWPATMESAVRSGYLAAEAIMRSAGRAERFLVPDLTPGPLSRLLIKH